MIYFDSFKEENLVRRHFFSDPPNLIEMIVKFPKVKFPPNLIIILNRRFFQKDRLFFFYQTIRLVPSRYFFDRKDIYDTGYIRYGLKSFLFLKIPYGILYAIPGYSFKKTGQLASLISLLMSLNYILCNCRFIK